MSLQGIFRRRRLPHWDVADATYFVTSCLEGSIPAHGLRDLRKYRLELDDQPRPRAMTEDEWEARKHKLVFAHLDRIIDHESAIKWLERAELAASIVKSLYHFAGQRYHFLAYVVMPSHLHWVFQPTREWCQSIAEEKDVCNRTPRERILHSLKSFTANECHALLGRTGTFWQDESYEHCVRDDDELRRIIDYVELNPVKALLASQPVAWQFSSACDRLNSGIPVGDPLLRPM